jgi:hypothetical protein
MELTGKERLLLVAKKEEIRKLTEEIFELTTDFMKNETELKKKVTGILSLMSTIASYTNSKNINMRVFIAFTHQIFYSAYLGQDKVATTAIELFCNVVNSMTFNFTKRDLKINIQKIDLSFIKTGN